MVKVRNSCRGIVVIYFILVFYTSLANLFRKFCPFVYIDRGKVQETNMGVKFESNAKAFSPLLYCNLFLTFTHH